MIEPGALDALVGALRARGYLVLGPTVQDGAIVYAELETAGELPTGWTDRQLLAALLASAVPAPAAFPGVNGKVAFWSMRDGNLEVYLMNADGSDATRLTTNPTLDAEHAWSPDGAKLLFWSDRQGNFDIYVMNTDGNGQTRVTDDPAADFSPDWQPVVTASACGEVRGDGRWTQTR